MEPRRQRATGAVSAIAVAGCSAMEKCGKDPGSFNPFPLCCRIGAHFYSLLFTCPAVDEAAPAADAKYVHAAFGSSSCVPLLRTVALATPVRVWYYVSVCVSPGWFRSACN